jgi:hypothetical protein
LGDFREQDRSANKHKFSLGWVKRKKVRRPVSREWLIIEVIVGKRREAHSLRRAVGHTVC